MKNIYIILILFLSFTIYSCAKKTSTSSTPPPPTTTTELGIQFFNRFLFDYFMPINWPEACSI